MGSAHLLRFVVFAIALIASFMLQGGTAAAQVADGGVLPPSRGDCITGQFLDYYGQTSVGAPPPGCLLYTSPSPRDS